MYKVFLYFLFFVLEDGFYMVVYIGEKFFIGFKFKLFVN